MPQQKTPDTVMVSGVFAYIIVPPCRNAVGITCYYNKQGGYRPPLSGSLRPTEVGRSALRRRSRIPVYKV